MNVVVNIVPEDYRWYFRYNFYHFQKVHVSLIWLYIALTVVGQFGSGDTATRQSRLTAQAMATLVVMFMAYGYYRSIDRQMEQFQLPVGEHAYEIGDRCVRCRNSNGSYESLSHSIREARETDHYFLIVFQDASAAIIPKREVADCNSLRTAIDALNVLWVK